MTHNFLSETLHPPVFAADGQRGEFFCEINVRCNTSYVRQGVGRSIPDISSMTTLIHSGIILNYYKAVKTLLGSVGHQRTAKSWTSARTRIVAAMVFILMNIDDGNINDKVITLMMTMIID